MRWNGVCSSCSFSPRRREKAEPPSSHTSVNPKEGATANRETGEVLPHFGLPSYFDVYPGAAAGNVSAVAEWWSAATFGLGEFVLEAALVSKTVELAKVVGQEALLAGGNGLVRVGEFGTPMGRCYVFDPEVVVNIQDFFTVNLACKYCSTVLTRQSSSKGEA